MKAYKSLFFSTLIVILLVLSCNSSDTILSGELKQWHTITLSIDGPETSEQAEPNPFTDYRLVVTFTHENKNYKIRGFYAADGNPAESGTDSGNKWQVRFTPDAPGKWNYEVSFRQGSQIAVSNEPFKGVALDSDGLKGNFKVQSSDKSGRDFRGRGRLSYNGFRYLQFAGNGEYFLKGGADSPENFLGYVDFDGTSREGDRKQREGEADPSGGLHTYLPHSKDWTDGDPSWQDGKGKAMIGALNYLASKGMNSVYFLTMNIEGDGKDVWPYTGYDERFRFDCSKLDQWEIVFSHMEKLGLMLHIVTQETENELLLDAGDTGIERKLYYLELISRFSHHLAITWNMGEENGFADFTPEAQNREQQKEMIKFMKENDPYKNFVALHTHANPKHRYEIFNDLLGFEYLDGPSVQIGNPANAHNETLTWIAKSAEAGKPWVVNIDEIGPAWKGVDPDDRPENNQDSVRSSVLWGNLMAGGGGVEWYFGYKNHNNDLNCEDWRSRDQMWDYTRYALEFFRKYLPFNEMTPADELTSNPEDYVLAKAGEIYAVYIPAPAIISIDFTKDSGNYEVKWYNPREGGKLINGEVTNLTGGSVLSIGSSPKETKGDWVALIRKVE